MLILITGTPGAGKSLHAVWEFARKVPGSTIEHQGGAVARRLLSNVKDLLVEHERIGPEDLNTWHTWAKPGDVILYDEVQEVWRPRGMGSKVPDCIAALETHRHLGVDIILVTQHPMLVDPNIRRLVNQHLHLRRLSKGTAMIYEWDHCANPGQVKTALQSKVWFHPKKAYALYKSAQLHTKPTARLPRVAVVGVVALGVFFGLGYSMWGRMQERFTGTTAQAKAPASKDPQRAAAPPQSAASAAPGAVAPAGAASAPGPVLAARPAILQGCIASATRCLCFDGGGVLVPQSVQECRDIMATPGNLVASSGTMSAIAAIVPPVAPQADASREAAAPGQPRSAPVAGEVAGSKPAGSAS